MATAGTWFCRSVALIVICIPVIAKGEGDAGKASADTNTTRWASVATEKMGPGTLKNYLYENQYLGLSLAIPTNWAVQDHETQRAMVNAGLSLAAGDDENRKNAMIAAAMDTISLFSTFKYPVGLGITNNPSIFGLAEAVQDVPEIRRGKDYLFRAREMLALAFHVSFPKSIYSTKLGGVDFDVMEIEILLKGEWVKERYYATVRKGYALAFIQVYDNEDDELFERAVLEKMKFK